MTLAKSTQDPSGFKCTLKSDEVGPGISIFKGPCSKKSPNMLDEPGPP